MDGSNHIFKIFQITISGTRWRHIGGKLKQIEAGPNGVLWGVNRANYIYHRTGVTRRNPIGRYWKLVKGRLNHISVGCTGVVGINRRGQIFRYSGTYQQVLVSCPSFHTHNV